MKIFLFILVFMSLIITPAVFAAESGPEPTSSCIPLPTTSVTSSGANPSSRFLIAGATYYESGDTVAGTSKTATQVAEMYKPYFVWGSEL